jgi:EpsD family peptidyl-prolyl cis-trans isomerase
MNPGLPSVSASVLVALLACAVTAGCERVAAGRGDTQLAARVNGVEISARQLRASGAANAAQALEKVIERELLVQKALEAGLERDPQVAESIDAARRQLLAQAYLDKIAVGKNATREEVHAFYAGNPALFAERRIYRLRELAVAAPAELVDVLGAEAAQAADLDQVAAWLRARGASFSAAATTLPAEQVPLSQLPRLARMKDGEIAVFPAPGGAAVVQIVRAEAAALSESQAAPLIEQFLAGRKRLEVAAAEVKRLRQVATIEYAGEFRRNN